MLIKLCRNGWEHTRLIAIDRTQPQDEMMGRFFHTLSAALSIGAMTLFFSGESAGHYLGLRVCAMFVLGVILFVAGMVLNKGEKNDGRISSLFNGSPFSGICPACLQSGCEKTQRRGKASKNSQKKIRKARKKFVQEIRNERR